MSVLLAVALSSGIALAGWRLRALTFAAAVTAVAVGTAILCPTGWTGMAALGAFFVGASLISRLAPDRTSPIDGKGNIRDPWQVLANGGAAALGAWVPGAGTWIVVAALAAASADTWATSTGGWSRTAPRLVVSLRPVEAGTSGGLTPLGTAGALVGAALVGAAAGLVSGAPVLLPLGLGIGMAGMLADSLLGATVQGKFHCDRCDQRTERAQHRCGDASRQTGGIAWITNDAVNGMATALAALLGGSAWWVWHG